MILPSTDLKGATTYCAKIFEKIRKISFECTGEKLKVTVSAGLSFINYNFTEKKYLEPDAVDKLFQKLQNEADNALYETKYLGKNKFCQYSPDKKDEYLKIRKLYVK